MFEKFRNNSLKNYGLCLSHYLSESGLSWDAIYKMTKIKLKLISDPDMYRFFEKVTRGTKGTSILEVDFEYPDELQELHNDYPLTPDKIEINKEMSEYQLCWLTFLIKNSMCFAMKTYNFT